MTTIEKFIANQNRKKKSEETIKGYLITINLAIEVTKKNPEEWTIADIEEFAIYLENKYAETTYNKHISYLRVFVKYICTFGVNDKIDLDKFNDEYSTINAGDKKAHGEEAIPVEEFRPFMQFVSGLKADSLSAQKKKVGVLLLGTTGLRRVECANLKKSDVDLALNTIDPSRTKNNKERKVYLKLNRLVRQEILKLYQMYDQMGIKGDYVLMTDKGNKIHKNQINFYMNGQSGNNGVCEMAMRKGIISKKATPHSVRKGYATFLRYNPDENKRLEIEEIRDILGHSSIKMTEIYTQLDNRKSMAKVEDVEIF